MLTVVNPAKRMLGRPAYLPQMLQPLAIADGDERDVVRSTVAIVRNLGFDNFMYGASASPKLDHESRSYVFTTLSREWVRRYDEQAYIDVDTRISRALDSPLPLIWDYETERGHDTKADAFLDDSLAHGVGSGVVCGMHGAGHTRVIFALSSAAPKIDDEHRGEIVERLGDILLLGACFHEIFMKSVVEKGIPPPSQGAPLSSREKQCLALAARGQTTQDIASQLGIAERKVQFHFDGIRSKLGAANRQEAIAKAVLAGFVKG
jgi:DNA-binding CsgD family transcriptional regulator